MSKCTFINFYQSILAHSKKGKFGKQYINAIKHWKVYITYAIIIFDTEKIVESFPLCLFPSIFLCMNLNLIPNFNCIKIFFNKYLRNVYAYRVFAHSKYSKNACVAFFFKTSKNKMRRLEDQPVSRVTHRWFQNKNRLNCKQQERFS